MKYFLDNPLYPIDPMVKTFLIGNLVVYTDETGYGCVSEESCQNCPLELYKNGKHVKNTCNVPPINADRARIVEILKQDYPELFI